MAIRKLKTQRTDARLQLESDDPVELPPAQVEESAVVLQFDSVRQYVPELLDTLRAGTVAELVPVMRDGATFAIHTATRTFWVKLWHSSADMTRVEHVQVLSCLPSTRGVRLVVGDDEDDFDEFDEDEFDEDESGDVSIATTADANADDESDDESSINSESR